MLARTTVGGIGSVFVIIALLQVISSHAQILNGGQISDASTSETVAADPLAENAPDHEDPADYVWDSSEVIPIVLDGTAIAMSGTGVTVDGSKATITRGGTYDLTGVLTDGQIIVDSKNKKTVRLILDGADIRCSWSAPLIVENAKKTVIVLAEETANCVTDRRSSLVESSSGDEPNAALFSKDNLTICGGGSLTVYGAFKDGISSKNGLIVAGGVITVTAVDDGIRGKDYLVVRGGKTTVTSGGDGLKSDNDQDPYMGYVSIESGVLNVVSGSDGIQAATDVVVSGGEITLRAGGGSSAGSAANLSAKGITAGVAVSVSGGSLTIDSADDAIHSNGSMAIAGGTLVLSSMDDAIHADSAVDVNRADIRIARCYEGIDSNDVTIAGGNIRIVSSNDGITTGQSLSIANGVITVAAGGDAITAQTDLRIADGNFTLSSGGGSSVKLAATASAKGIKGVGSVVIDSGDFTVDSADDTIHSNGDITINGGTFVLYSGDDGIHADANLVVNDGNIRIAKSYEGMESANANITINGGTIHITSSDDGISVSAGGDPMAGGATGPGQGGGPGTPPGQQPGGGGTTQPTTTGNYFLYINGGYLVVDAQGDGLDSNGSIAMTAGTVLVNGPTANDNGALDHSSFTMTGGFIVAAGSSGMAQTTSTTSTQYGILITFSTTLAAGTMVHIQESQSGADVLSFVPTKQYNSVAFSSPKLVKGVTYDVYYGGRSTGTLSDGLYQNGTYAPGTKFASFTVSSMVTNVGAGSGGIIRR